MKTIPFNVFDILVRSHTHYWKKSGLLGANTANYKQRFNGMLESDAQVQVNFESVLKKKVENKNKYKQRTSSSLNRCPFAHHSVCPFPPPSPRTWKLGLGNAVYSFDPCEENPPAVDCYIRCGQRTEIYVEYCVVNANIYTMLYYVQRDYWVS